VELRSGTVVQARDLPEQYFGEGIALVNDSLIQLTWKSNTGFIYDKSTFVLTGSFAYPTEGWGLTYDGERLIMSDGTSTLHFLDPETFAIVDAMDVHDNDTPVDKLNELEYIDGRIYANVWLTDKIAIINPQNGQVTGWLDLSGLADSQESSATIDVANGIAYDAQEDRQGQHPPQRFPSLLSLGRSQGRGQAGGTPLATFPLPGGSPRPHRGKPAGSVDRGRPDPQGGRT
jgi:glutamine cyclotransferase